LFVEGLDAIDGTPVLDIKPLMKEFFAARRLTSHTGRRSDEGLLVNHMNVPDRIVTLLELRRNTGERGSRKLSLTMAWYTM